LTPPRDAVLAFGQRCLAAVESKNPRLRSGPKDPKDLTAKLQILPGEGADVPIAKLASPVADDEAVIGIPADVERARGTVGVHAATGAGCP